MKGRRITMVLGAVALGLGLMATGAVAKSNACKAECVTQKKARLTAAKNARTACRAAATDKTAKKACNTAFHTAVKAANGSFHTNSKACKSDPTAHLCTGSPSGAFLS